MERLRRLHWNERTVPPERARRLTGIRSQVPHPIRVMVDLICLLISWLFNFYSGLFWFFFVQGRFEETNGRTSPLPVAVPP